MSLVRLIRHDLRRLRRSKLIVAVGLFPVVLLSSATAAWIQGLETTTARIIQYSTVFTLFLFPIVALSVSTLSIAGEHERGTLRVLLGFPIKRRTLFIGKVVSRLFMTNLFVIITFVCTTSILFIKRKEILFNPMIYWKFVMLTIIYTTMMTVVGVGISAAASSQSRAVAGTACFYLVSVFGWSPASFASIPEAIQSVARSLIGETPALVVFDIMQALGPATGYVRSIEFATTRGMLVTPKSVFYLRPQVMIGVLFFWIFVPLLVGYHIFEQTDIG